MKRSIAFLCAVSLVLGCIALFVGCAPKELGAYAADEPHVVDTAVDPNDASFDPVNIKERKQTTLKGKTIYWLGSSVLLGAASDEYSMADYIAVRNDAVCVKEAVSGTTLKSMDNKQDYVNRLLDSTVLDKNAKIDAFIVQISTNDVLAKEQWGAVTTADVTDRNQFDLSTSLGGVEYIISYIHETWNCPVYFFSGSYFGTTPVNGYVRDAFWNSGDDYGELVGLVQQAVDKWNAMEGYDVQMIDLYNDAAFNSSITTEEYRYYMDSIFRGGDTYADDPIHPRKAGYLYWWTPYFEEFLHYNIGTP